MTNSSLVITSIANDNHPVLKLFAKEAKLNRVKFILIGDTKSPKEFHLAGCNFYSIEQQLSLGFKLSRLLPTKHYARKTLGYLIAMSSGSKIIVESDDDNIPLESFWTKRYSQINGFLLEDIGWVNVYKYFTHNHIWPRGFPLDNLRDSLPKLNEEQKLFCPIQQGLADDNPDVDALYRLIYPLPIKFNPINLNISLGNGAFCPFNSQNTTWFKEAFPLMYLPSFCSFRMTDIWRSFITQRIAWTCNWPILFRKSSVRQERNSHDLKKDLEDELCGYMYNKEICKRLMSLELLPGIENIPINMIRCYENLISYGIFDKKEMILLKAWLEDVKDTEKYSN